jgi:hypothetical protein
LAKISRITIISIVILAVVVVGVGTYFLVQPISSKNSKSTSSILPLSSLQPAVEAHVSHLNTRNVTLIVSDYANNATVYWFGITGGMGGIYTGTNNIQILYAGSFASAQSISLTIDGYTQGLVNSTTALAQLNMTMNGKSSILGTFEGKISAGIYYVTINGQWKIIDENWNYLEMGGTAMGGGATTFPQWHTPPRQSPDAFKNFVFNYGGSAYTAIIFGYVAIILVLFLAAVYRRKQRD